jgi:thioredoxin reductase (NADPH)
MTDMPTVFVPEKMYDLLIIGLGPAGVSCALQAYRDGLACVAIGDEPVGGLVRAASGLTNLPGATNLSGDAFAHTLETQLAALELPLCSGRVVNLVRSDRGFEAVLHDRHSIRAKTVCVATGTRPVYWSLGDALEGVHRDARSLPADLAAVAVAIIGGGEAALDTALSVVEKRGRALILVRSDRLRAAPRLMLQAQDLGVEIRFRTVIAQVAGRPGKWMLTSTTGDEILADMLVVCIGRVPCDELFRGLRSDTSNDAGTGMGIPGLWLAGDVLRTHDRYVALALGDGQRAALCASRYLRGVSLLPPAGEGKDEGG